MVANAVERKNFLMAQVLIRQFVPPFVASLVVSVLILLGWNYWQRRGCLIPATAENQGQLAAKLDVVVRESESANRLLRQQGEALLQDLDRLEKYLSEEPELDSRLKAIETELATLEAEVNGIKDLQRPKLIASMGSGLMVCNAQKGRQK